MRLRHPDGTVVHLAYCTNVHPAEDIDGVLGQVRTYAAAIRDRLGWPLLGLGLWLADDVARAFDEDEALLARLAATLASAGCEVVTLNGFPYAGFHDEVVKRAVYRPDWTTAERREHTLRLARILAALLPDDVDFGTISTLPLGWREWLDADGVSRSIDALIGLSADLADLRERTGKQIAIAVEPEPGCVVQDTAGLASRLGGHAGPHLGACLDLCHLAVQHEDPRAAAARLEAAGVAVHKVQVSVGLRLDAPAAAEQRALAASFVPSKFLHQARAGLREVDDLPEALDGGLPDDEEWRVHVHLPVNTGGPHTTTATLAEALEVLVGGPTCLTQHLEVETYTWTVLPSEARPHDLVEGIARELEWTAERVAALGLVALAREPGPDTGDADA